MAFKRDGDDLSQLNLLRKRRVADLLASFIPEDEAILMKNGRYACSVCSRRPVFDTVDMLAVHRTGKKHVASLQRYYGKQRGLQLEIQKRRHQEHVREEEAGVQQKPTEPAPLLRDTRRIVRHALLREAPYNSCCTRPRPGTDDRRSAPGHSNAPATNWQPLTGGITEKATVVEESSTSDTQPTTSHPAWEGTRAESQGEKVRGRKKKGRKKSQASEPSTPVDPERQKVLEHYLQLRSSGWIQDGCGGWTRDEMAEFDSDEEEPPQLALP